MAIGPQRIQELAHELAKHMGPAAGGSARTITLEESKVEDIRMALMLGLSLLGEFKQRKDAWDSLAITNFKAPETLKPIAPIDCVEDVSIFANALLCVQYFDASTAVHS